tara:strand:- start:2183 stop:2749 length:567 start_codon:yes stop_codon:yes gene_type:complete
MATTKYLTITDLFANATTDTTSGSESVTIPISDITGFSAAELVADVAGDSGNDGDGRKLAFGLVDAIANGQTGEDNGFFGVQAAYDAIVSAAAAWATATSYTTGDYITDDSVIYQALQTHTSSGTDFNSASTQGGNPIWEEATLQQEPVGIVPKVYSASMSGAAGTATGSQKYQFTFQYSGTTDIADE